MRRFLLLFLVFSCLLCLFPAETRATLSYNCEPVNCEVEVFDFEIFTSNGKYHDDSRLNFNVKVLELDCGRVGFKFHNDSIIRSSIAHIYFENDLFKKRPVIINSAGAYFRHGARPSYLPGRWLLEPIFDANPKYNISACPPMSHKGVNPGEWVGAVFNLQCGFIYDDVINSLNSGDLRIGLHIISLPDCSSESAVSIPEPATTGLMAIGWLILFRNRERKKQL